MSEPELSDYEQRPWYRRWPCWWWWKPRVLWWTLRDWRSPVRSHETGEIVGHLRWRGAWLQSNAVAELRMGATYPMESLFEDDDA